MKPARLRASIRLKPSTKKTVELGHLFVEPLRLKGGIGRKLVEHAVNEAGNLSFHTLKIQGDPNAEGFYLSLRGNTNRGTWNHSAFPDACSRFSKWRLNKTLSAATAYLNLY